MRVPLGDRAPARDLVVNLTLTDRVVLVTGATANIGAATAIAFGREGDTAGGAMKQPRAELLLQLLDLCTDHGGGAMNLAGGIPKAGRVSHLKEVVQQAEVEVRAGVHGGSLCQ